MTQIFINIFIIYYRKRGDGNIDIDGKIISIPFVVQCKCYEYRKIGPETVRQLKGVLSYKSWDTIGILVIPNRNDFTRGVIEAVNNSLYNILNKFLTNQIINLYHMIINNSKNNNLFFYCLLIKKQVFNQLY